MYIAGFSNLHFHTAWLPWLLPNDWFSRWLVPPKAMNDGHLGHRAVLGFAYLNPTTSYKFTNKGKFWRNCTRGQIAMRSTSLEGYAWSHGRGVYNHPTFAQPVHSFLYKFPCISHCSLVLQMITLGYSEWVSFRNSQQCCCQCVNGVKFVVCVISWYCAFGLFLNLKPKEKSTPSEWFFWGDFWPFSKKYPVEIPWLKQKKYWKLKMFKNISTEINTSTYNMKGYLGIFYFHNLNIAKFG